MACLLVASAPVIESCTFSRCSSVAASSSTIPIRIHCHRHHPKSSRCTISTLGVGIWPRKWRCDSKPDDEVYLPELQVPRAWVSPDIAAQEAEWLRRALQRWLDEEYCPEPANEEISRRCSKVYYYCLLEEQLDVGDILMQMVRELETFSFKESFHGAFSSANAAIALITNRMRGKGDISN